MADYNSNSIKLKTYVIHCKKLLSRKIMILKQLNHHNFQDYEFYEDYDSEEIDDEMVKNIYNHSANNQIKKLKLWYPEIHNPRIMNRNEISLTYKFYKIFEKIANGDENSALIFEDDVILDRNFTTLFNKFYEETPKDFDAIFFGSGANLKIKETKPNIHHYVKNHPASRCADSFLITKKACKEIISTYLPFSIVSDWEIAYQMYHHNHKVYWWEPSLVKQGSEHGIFKSTLR